MSWRVRGRRGRKYTSPILFVLLKLQVEVTCISVATLVVVNVVVTAAAVSVVAAAAVSLAAAAFVLHGVSKDFVIVRYSSTGAACRCRQNCSYSFAAPSFIRRGMSTGIANGGSSSNGNSMSDHSQQQQQQQQQQQPSKFLELSRRCNNAYYNGGIERSSFPQKTPHF